MSITAPTMTNLSNSCSCHSFCLSMCMNELTVKIFRNNTHPLLVMTDNSPYIFHALMVQQAHYINQHNVTQHVDRLSRVILCLTYVWVHGMKVLEFSAPRVVSFSQRSFEGEVLKNWEAPYVGMLAQQQATQEELRSMHPL